MPGYPFFFSPLSFLSSLSPPSLPVSLFLWYEQPHKQGASNGSLKLFFKHVFFLHSFSLIIVYGDIYGRDFGQLLKGGSDHRTFGALNSQRAPITMLYFINEFYFTICESRESDSTEEQAFAVHSRWENPTQPTRAWAPTGFAYRRTLLASTEGEECSYIHHLQSTAAAPQVATNIPIPTNASILEKPVSSMMGFPMEAASQQAFSIS